MAFFPSVFNCNYWSSTNYLINAEYAYVIRFGSEGDIYYSNKSNELGTRCVQGKRESSFDAVEITVNPSSLVFGIVDIDSTSSLDITVINSGLGNLIINTIDAPSVPFSIQHDGCSNQTLGLNASCILTTAFSPLEEAVFMDTIIIQSNDIDNPDIVIPLAGSTSSFLPDTGQTTCYDNEGNIIDCPLPDEPLAQDGSYTINPPSYTVYGDGTVTDNITGLMWQQEDDNQVYNWYQATGIYDKRLNRNVDDVCGNLTLGGYTDWRLPTKKELVGIVHYGEKQPAMDQTVFPNTNMNGYWSSDNLADDLNFALVVDFNIGDIRYYGKEIEIPMKPEHKPSHKYIKWHVEEVFHHPGLYIERAG